MLSRYERAAFKVEAVPSAAECLSRLALHGDEFDFILLDYGLPGDNGLTLLKRLKGYSSVPPVIMLTGQGDREVAVEALRHGAYDYFPKDSITSEVLGHAIDQAFQKRRLEQQLFREQMEGTEQVIFTMAAVAEAKDPTTEDHLQRMARYAVRLGMALSLNERDLLILRYSGILHDIGKIGISEAILRAPRPLHDDEWEEIRRHPAIGERICAPLRLSHDLGPIIRHHHERWDGEGYVDRLAGEEIPFLARVISVVDAFDAMTADRLYRPALGLEEAVRRLAQGSGTQWDPAMVETLLDVIQREGEGFVLTSDDLATSDLARAA
ncbi:MAG: HD domain-containing phosphohydrolase [Dehalococcoidia bacterium]